MFDIIFLDGPLSLSRPILLDMLQTRLSDMCTIHISMGVISYHETSSGSVLITFQDGSTRAADILIGADGVHSTVRSVLYQGLAKTDPSQNYEKYCEPKWR